MEYNDAGEGAFGESDLISLGQKLATLDLTDRERAALGALLSDEDVGGYGRYARFNIAGGIRTGFRTFGRAGRTPGIRAGRAGFRAPEPGTPFPPGPPNRL